MPAPGTIRLVDPDGVIRDVDTSAAESALQDPRWRVAATEDELGRVDAQAKEEAYGGAGGAVKAGAAAVARGATLGLSDLAARVLGGEDTAIELQGLREANPGISTGGEVLGALAPALLTGGSSAGASAGEIGAGVAARGLASRLPAAAVSRLGAGIARAGAEAGLVGKVGYAALGGAVEGALYGAGTGISEVSLADRPLDIEHVAAAIGSNALYGAGLGGAIGGAGKLAEVGLARAKGAIDTALERRAVKARTPAEGIDTGDLELLDTPKLKEARQAELDALEAARQPDRQKLVEDLADYRDRMHEIDAFKMHHGIEDGGIRELGGILKRGDRHVRDALNNKVKLATDPRRALDGLQEQAQAMQELHGWASSQLEKQAGRDLTAEALADLQADAVDAARSAESKIPTYQRLRGQAEAPVTTIPSSELQKRGWYEPPGQGADLVKAENARAAIRAGQREPITVVVGDDGKLFVHDGRNRLNAAIEQGAPIKVRWDHGTVSGEGDVFKGGMAGAEPLAPPIRRVPNEIGPFTPAGMQLAAEREAARRSAELAPNLKRLDNIELMFPGAIEKNQALQKRITDLALPPTSDRLTKIDDALEHLGAPKAPSFADAAIGLAAPFAGPLGVAAAAGARTIGGLRKLAAAATERTGKAVSSFLGATAKVAPVATPLATKVLTSVRYDGGRRSEPEADLPAAYKARSDEIKRQVQVAPDGSYQMRPAARAKMAAKLDGIRVADPRAADQIETAGARRIAWLASQLPKRPDTAGIQVGPDTWKPPELEMRSWARKVSAAEDPHGVLDRLVGGTVTPEDAEAMRAVHPEILADLISQITTQLPTLRATLPHARLVALSILTGMPVSPSMDPAVLSLLQAQYTYEPEKPRAQPQFGSVKNTAEPGTASQRREEGTAR